MREVGEELTTATKRAICRRWYNYTDVVEGKPLHRYEKKTLQKRNTYTAIMYGR